ncbi:lipopolysaccharide kinase InaA family protein [Alcanivorax sediminis]|uniref:lipopolysaccharide kinase InaA family protein n=1 Tax=Alcanivorax sediminis TaxID=2663008 RepID=UPI0018860D65|nr:lipopolysaccharide kinase InaA family protein [Alcanivorax sediminis]
MIYRDQEAVASLLAGESVQAWFSAEHQILKQGGKVEARLLKTPAGVVFVKHYRAKNLFRRVISWLGVFRARRIFRLSLELRRIGVRVPEPMAYLMEKRRDCSSSFFVCEGLDAEDLKSIAVNSGLEAIGGVERVFADVVELLVGLHQAGYAHGDTKWANWMVRRSDSQLVLIDLDGVFRPFWFRNKHFGRDLARFLINARELRIHEYIIEAMLANYAKQRGRSVTQVCRDLGPAYDKLAKRHRQKYGSQL